MQRCPSSEPVLLASQSASLFRNFQRKRSTLVAQALTGTHAGETIRGVHSVKWPDHENQILRDCVNCFPGCRGDQGVSTASASSPAGIVESAMDNLPQRSAAR